MKFNCSQRLLISLVLAFIHLCYPATGFGTATCYLPGGSVAEDDAPCYDTLPSQCCPTADGICLSNGLCFSTTDNVVARSSCTDQTWQSHGCSSFCTTINTNEFCPLTPCGGDMFCCGQGPPADNCCLGNVGFPVGKAIASLPTETQTQTVTSTSVVTVAAAGGVFTSTETISTTTTVSTVVSTTVSVTKTFSTDKSSSTTVEEGSGAAASTTQFNNAEASADSCPSCSTKEVAVGAGVGIPLGAALIFSLILLFLRGKRHKNPPQPPVMTQPYPPISPQPVPVGGYPSPGDQYVHYQQGYMRPRDRDPPASDPIPVPHSVSPELGVGSDDRRYELGGQVRRGEPPSYVGMK